MLTKELAIADYDFERGRILPDRLTRRSHAHYVRYADRAVRIYRQGAGSTRRDLHRAVHGVFAREENCPARRIDALCKLLDDGSTFDRDRRGKAAELRQRVFQLAAARHPLVEHADRLFETVESEVKRDIAKQLGQSWLEIEQQLFSDVIDFHRLRKFDRYDDGVSLLARYNVAQVQAALYGASSATVWATEDFKTILRYAKLARLMHDVTRDPDGGFRLRLDGPASVLRGTRRYGAAMARFLPALIACRGWRLQARIPTRRGGNRWQWRLQLSDTDGLHSHLPSPDEFDSEVERAFAAQWGDAPREGWSLERESEVLYSGQTVFIPDFVFRHTDGRSVMLEIVGFWTPEYLAKKVKTLHSFRQHAVLVAVAEQTRNKLTENDDTNGWSNDTITYKTRLKVTDVLQWLERDGAADRPDRST